MEYKKVKSILEYFYKELEKQAEKDGVLTDSLEYQKAKLEIKRRVLLKLKIDLNEFEDIENAQQEKTEKLTKQEKKELVKEVVKDEVLSKDDIQKLIDDTKKPPQIINKIVKEKIIEKPIITHETRVIKETIKELDKTELNKLGADLFKLQSDFTSLYDRVEQIKIPDYNQITEALKKDSADHITGLWGTMPDFRAMAMGLRGDIDRIEGLINTENLFDRTSTVLSPHTAGDSLNMGTGAITTTGIGTFDHIIETTPTLVPYTGATADVDLGFQDFGTNGVIYTQNIEPIPPYIGISIAGVVANYYGNSFHPYRSVDNWDLGKVTQTWRDLWLSRQANINTIAISTGSITDSTGAISFDNENLSTIGTLGAGAITGTSLIKSGGTSSQFLKADGSVDSTSYQALLINSAGLAAALNDETGSGLNVFNNSPTFIGTSIFAPTTDVVPLKIKRGTDISPTANLIEVYKYDGATLLAAMAYDGRWRLGLATAAPTIVADTGAGAGATATLTGTDSAGELTITTAGVPSAASAICTITFSRAFVNAPSVIFSPSSATSALLSGVTMIYATSTTTTFVLTSGSTGLTTGTVYKFFYHCLGQ
jgi:hypothetical protein